MVSITLTTELCKRIGGIWIQTSKVETRTEKINVMLEFVSIEDSLLLVFADKHLAAIATSLVGRNQTIQVTLLYNGANGLLVSLEASITYSSSFSFILDNNLFNSCLSHFAPLAFS